MMSDEEVQKNLYYKKIIAARNLRQRMDDFADYVDEVIWE